MNIIRGRPPNYEEIIEFLPTASKIGTIFTYGDDVYVTGPNPLSPALQIHEAVHIRQQRAIGRDAWWERYLCDIDFRFAQELEAHRAEYFYYTNMGRNIARVNLNIIAKRLASPLYGNIVTKQKAKTMIKGIL